MAMGRREFLLYIGEESLYALYRNGGLCIMIYIYIERERARVSLYILDKAEDEVWLRC